MADRVDFTMMYVAHHAFTRDLERVAADSKRGGSKADVQNTLTHELGHALGLQHEADVTDAVMFPIAYDGDVDKRQLSGDDMAGLGRVVISKWAKLN